MNKNNQVIFELTELTNKFLEEFTKIADDKNSIRLILPFILTKCVRTIDTEYYLDDVVKVNPIFLERSFETMMIKTTIVQMLNGELYDTEPLVKRLMNVYYEKPKLVGSMEVVHLSHNINPQDEDWGNKHTINLNDLNGNKFIIRIYYPYNPDKHFHNFKIQITFYSGTDLTEFEYFAAMDTYTVSRIETPTIYNMVSTPSILNRLYRSLYDTTSE